MLLVGTEAAAATGRGRRRLVERLLVDEVEFGLLAHAHAYVVRRVTVEVVDALEGDGQPEAEHDNDEHGELEREVLLAGEEEVADAEEHVLRVEDDVVDEIAQAGGARLQVEVDEYVDEGADEVVELLEYLLARVVHLLRGDAVVGLQAQYPEVHDQPVGEHDHEEPGTESAGEERHGEDARRYEEQVPQELHDGGDPAHGPRKGPIGLEAEDELLIAQAAVVAGERVAHGEERGEDGDELLDLEAGRLKVLEGEDDQVGGRAHLAQILRGDHVELEQHLRSAVHEDVDEAQHADVRVALDLLLDVVLLPLEVVEERAARPALERVHEALYVLPDEVELKDDEQHGRYPERDRVARGLGGRVLVHNRLFFFFFFFFFFLFFLVVVELFLLLLLLLLLSAQLLLLL